MSKRGISISKSEDDWMAESDMRTLMEAEKIKSDPKRHAKAKACAEKRLKEMAVVASEKSES